MDEDEEDCACLFERGMKLEAVNPSQPRQVCAATIVRVVDRLLWLRIDAQPEMHFVICNDSHDIFPIGWCASNNYPLKTPVRRVLVMTSTKTSGSATQAE